MYYKNVYAPISHSIHKNTRVPLRNQLTTAGMNVKHTIYIHISSCHQPIKHLFAYTHKPRTHTHKMKSRHWIIKIANTQRELSLSFASVRLPFRLANKTTWWYAPADDDCLISPTLFTYTYIYICCHLSDSRTTHHLHLCAKCDICGIADWLMSVCARVGVDGWWVFNTFHSHTFLFSFSHSTHRHLCRQPTTPYRSSHTARTHARSVCLCATVLKRCSFRSSWGRVGVTACVPLHQ